MACVNKSAITQEESEEEIKKRLTELVLERPQMSEACVRQEYNKRREWGQLARWGWCRSPRSCPGGTLLVSLTLGSYKTELNLDLSAIDLRP